MEVVMKKLIETIEHDKERAAQKDEQIKSLIESIRLMPGVQNPVAVNVQPAVIDPVVVRAEKVQRLAMNMRKSNRIKIFKASSDSDIQIFLKKFGEELNTLKQMVRIVNDLTKDEYLYTNL